jgi:hypothetical protein
LGSDPGYGEKYMPLIAPNNHQIESPWKSFARRSSHDAESYQGKCMFASLTTIFAGAYFWGT